MSGSTHEKYLTVWFNSTVIPVTVKVRAFLSLTVQ